MCHLYYGMWLVSLHYSKSSLISLFSRNISVQCALLSVLDGQFLLNTLLSEDFWQWSESNNIIYYTESSRWAEYQHLEFS